MGEKEASGAPTSQPKKWEFRHPVLKMMGIPRVYVPSRNWLIFWAITGTLVAGITWDHRERRKVREMWKNRVSEYAKAPMTTMELPRKVRVFVAPPPNDYLDAGLKHWRRYIKPILTAAAVDHELVVEEGHQGHIRTIVAEEIRDRRRQAQGLPPVLAQAPKDELDRKIEKDLIRDPTGGVIIVGRGAFKEYMAGLHEGYLGPLDMPEDVRKDKESKEQALAKFDEAHEPENEQEYLEKRDHELLKKYPVTPSFLKAVDYPEASAAPQLHTDPLEPISVFRHPHLLGIFNTPQRLWRWLNQRYLADELCGQAAQVVVGHTRPFVLEDASLAASDEDDWPRRFKSQGLDKGSEWMQDLVVDPRVAEQLQVYTASTASTETFE